MIRGVARETLRRVNWTLRPGTAYAGRGYDLPLWADHQHMGGGPHLFGHIGYMQALDVGPLFLPPEFRRVSQAIRPPIDRQDTGTDHNVISGGHWTAGENSRAT